MSRDIQVRRWTRYGHDRLYVSTGDGTRIGWLDLKTGHATIERTDLADQFHAAIADHPGTSQAPASPLPSPPTSSPPASQRAWRDLALNRPGQAAREQAEEHLERMRDRSKALTFLARALDVKTDERAWRKGADGEETVGARLERLIPHGWRVLHSVPVGTRGSDIDHVLIGPGGVYAINTKHHPGKRVWVSPTQVRVDGQPVPYVRNSRHEAERASRLLTAAVGWEVRVRPALVFLTGSLIPNVTIKDGGPGDVLILDRMDIPRAFKKARARLAAEAVAELFEQARRSTTWIQPGR